MKETSIRQFPAGFLEEQTKKIIEKIEEYSDRQTIREAMQDGANKETGADPQYLSYIVQKQKEVVPGLKKALISIKNGDYGFCQRCEKEIEIERLKIEPGAFLCCSCIKCIKK